MKYELKKISILQACKVSAVIYIPFSPIGNRVRARVVKNKTAPPFRTAEFDIMFDEGISATGDLLDLATEDGIVEKSGSWFSYGETRLGQGRENSKLFLAENPDLFEEIKLKVLIARGVQGTADAQVAETVSEK